MQIHNAVITGSFAYNGVDISSVTSSTSNITSLNAITASILSTTASLNTASGSAITRLNSIESTTGSLNTASGSAITRLNAIEVVTGSNISRLSSIEAKTGSYATTGSNVFVGSQTITGSILGSGSLSINGCIVSTGQIVAQTINVQQVTSSIVYSCGSNVFGTALNNTQTICGNIFSTGSLACFAGTICAPAFVGGTVSGTSATFSSNLQTNCVLTIGNQGVAGNYFLQITPSTTNRVSMQGLLAGVGISDIVMQPSSGNVGIGACSPQQILSVNNPFSSLNAVYPVIISQTGNAEIGGMYSTADSITNPIGAGLAFKTYQVNVGLTEKLRITHAGYVGIGCTAPSGKLQVANSSTQYALYTLGGNLELYTPEGNLGYVRLGSAYNLNGVYGSCGLNYIVTGTSAHAFRTTDNNTERLRIFSTGEACFSCQVCAPRLQLNYCSTSAVLSIGNQDSTNDAGVRGLSIITDRLRFGVSPITSTYGAIATNGTNSGITFVTYDTAWCERVRIECTGIACFACQVCAPAGVKFGNGSTTLNYYEQGTWTPRLANGSFTTNAGVGNIGWYIRVGNIVTVGGTLIWGGGSGAQDGNSLRIACLPFASNGAAEYRSVGQFGAPAPSSIGFKNQCAQMTLVVDPGASFIYIIENYQSGTYLTYSHSPCVANAGTVYGFQATYITG